MSAFLFSAIFFIVSFLLAAINGEFQVQKPKVKSGIENDICAPKFCKDDKPGSKNVANFCLSKNGTLTKRCCLNQNQTIIGIDYTACNFTQLSDTVGILNRSLIVDVEILDVTNNYLIECGSRSTFAGFLALDQLYLTNVKSKQNICECPGGNYSWIHDNDDVCTGRKPICNSTFSPNINCTENSECAENGPGNFMCNCKSGFHGYKCLYEGTFPSILFTSIVCGSTLALSGFLWHFERRLVGKKHQN